MIEIVEYDKNMFTIKQFEDKLQAVINMNKDLLDARLFEHEKIIYFLLKFGDSKNLSTEIITFGPDDMKEVVKQINATTEVAKTQGKCSLLSDLRILNRLSRVVGFLILQKSKEATNERNDTDQKADAQARKNKKVATKANG